MSDISQVSIVSLYEKGLNEEATLDLSSRGLEIVPEIDNKLLRVLYLQSNNITSLPDDFFKSVPNLMWLDLRYNQLTEIPKSIKKHQSLTHLLLTSNNITSLPNELGTVKHLKVLQLGGNPLRYPPKEVISAGIVKLLNFLEAKYIDEDFLQSQSSVADENESAAGDHSVLELSFSNDARSYNSVLDEEKLNKVERTLSIQMSEKDETEDSDAEYTNRSMPKCRRLPKSRLKTLSPYSQSSKYLKELRLPNKGTQDERIRHAYLRQLAQDKHKQLLEATDKILQDRKNMEQLRNWRQNYRSNQLYNMSSGNSPYKADAKNYPYDTSPEYMTLLNREDIEKDLPDKYRKKLVRKSKPTVPRRNKNDVHLAMKIKQLFENLEAIDLNRETMTPRTEQKVLLGEIQKISEIKQKLNELTTTNMSSVPAD